MDINKKLDLLRSDNPDLLKYLHAHVGEFDIERVNYALPVAVSSMKKIISEREDKTDHFLYELLKIRQNVFNPFCSNTKIQNHVWEFVVQFARYFFHDKIEQKNQSSVDEPEVETETYYQETLLKKPGKIYDGFLLRQKIEKHNLNLVSIAFDTGITLDTANQILESEYNHGLINDTVKKFQLTIREHAKRKKENENEIDNELNVLSKEGVKKMKKSNVVKKVPENYDHELLNKDMTSKNIKASYISKSINVSQQVIYLIKKGKYNNGKTSPLVKKVFEFVKAFKQQEKYETYDGKKIRKLIKKSGLSNARAASIISGISHVTIYQILSGKYSNGRTTETVKKLEQVLDDIISGKKILPDKLKKKARKKVRKINPKVVAKRKQRKKIAKLESRLQAVLIKSDLSEKIKLRVLSQIRKAMIN